MKELVLVALVFLSAFAIAAPNDGEARSRREATTELLGFDRILRQLEGEVKAARNLDSLHYSNFFWSNPICGTGYDNADMTMKCAETFSKPIRNFLRLYFTIMSPETNPTEEELTKLANDFSQSLREIPLATVHELLYKDGQGGELSTANVNNLKEVYSVHPIGSGSELLEKLKECDWYLYCSVEEYGLRPKKGTNEIQRCDQDDVFYGKDKATKYKLPRIFEFLRNKENTLECAKGFASLIHELKQPNAYDDIERLQKNLAKDRFWDAVITILKETKMCFTESVLGTFKPKQVIREELKWRDMEFDSVDDYPQLLTIPARFDLLLLVAKMDIVHSKNFKPKYDCIFTDEDVKIYTDIAMSSDATLSDEKLEQIKSTNKKAYAFLYIINQYANMKRRKDDLSEEAASFYKKVVTLPNILLSRPHLTGTSDKVVAKRAELKAAIARDLTATPIEARKELVERFPLEALSLVYTLK